MQRSDLKAEWIMNATRPEIIRRFAEQIPFLEAIFPDYGCSISSPDDATYPTARNVPSSTPSPPGPRRPPTETVGKSRGSDAGAASPPTPAPRFLHLFARQLVHRPASATGGASELGPEYVAVRPDHLAQLYGQYLSRERILVHFPESVCLHRGLSARAVEVRSATSLRRPPTCGYGSSMDLRRHGHTRFREARSGPGNRFDHRRRADSQGRSDRTQRRLRHTARNHSAAPYLGHRVARPDPALCTARLLPPTSRAKICRTVPGSGYRRGAKRRRRLGGDQRPDRARLHHLRPLLPAAQGQDAELFWLRRTDNGAGVLAVLDIGVGGGVRPRPAIVSCVPRICR